MSESKVRRISKPRSGSGPESHSAQFSAGPCRKYHTHTTHDYPAALLGRSKNSVAMQEKVREVLIRTKEYLDLPEDYVVVLTAGGGTGAMETAIWNIIGARETTVCNWCFFGRRWLHDCKQVSEMPVHSECWSVQDIGSCSSGTIPLHHDVVLVYSSTTEGACLKNVDWLDPDNRSGLILADVTSIAYTGNVPWNDIDIATFSWQKVLGSEAGIGMLVMSPKAIARIDEWTPIAAIPALFQLRDGTGRFRQDLCNGATINTVSALVLEDYLQALSWFDSDLGRPSSVRELIERNYDTVRSAVDRSDCLEFIIENPAIRSHTASCLRVIELNDALLDLLLHRLEQTGIAFDIMSHPSSERGMRIWTGPTVATEDLSVLMRDLVGEIRTSTE